MGPPPHARGPQFLTCGFIRRRSCFYLLLWIATLRPKGIFSSGAGAVLPSDCQISCVLDDRRRERPKRSLSAATGCQVAVHGRDHVAAGVGCSAMTACQLCSIGERNAARWLPRTSPHGGCPGPGVTRQAWASGGSCPSSTGGAPARASGAHDTAGSTPYMRGAPSSALPGRPTPVGPRARRFAPPASGRFSGITR